MWTKKREPLLLAPDGSSTALQVAPRKDADGMLSLSVVWLRGWTVRAVGALPLGAMRLAEGPPRGGDDGQGHADIICQISSSGLATATSTARRGKPSTCTTSAPPRVPQQRLVRQRGHRVFHGHHRCRAVGLRHPARRVLDLATAETVPCGVLILLGLADDVDAPQWMASAPSSPIFARENSGGFPVPERWATAMAQESDPAARAVESQRRRMAEREYLSLRAGSCLYYWWNED